MQRTLGHCDSWRNPDDLRFTKVNINLNFPTGQLQCENIYDVIYALEVGKLISRDIPSLRVIAHEGQLWTLDNKLLYVCRISPKVKRVSVIHVSGQRFVEKFLGGISRAAMQRMSSAEFFPKVDQCEQSPRGGLTLRADRVRLSAVKKILEKEKIRGTPKSSSTGRSVASSATVTSRISSENTDSGTSFSAGSTCIQNSDSRTSSSLPDASSTDSSGASCGEAVESKAECYPAVRSMTGHHESESEPLPIPVEEKHETEAPCTRRSSIFPSSFSEVRPFTCQASPRFSRLLQRFPSAPRASRLVKRNSSDASIRLEPRSSRIWLQSDNPTDRLSSAAFPEDSRELVCRSFFASCRDDSRDTAAQSVSGKLPEENSPEIFSQGSPPNETGRNEPDDDFELEAFVLPEFCSPPPNFRDSKCDAEEEIFPVHNSQRPNNNGTPSSSRDRLDRSVSSCSSSTERPINNKPQNSEFPTKCEARKKGIESNSNSLGRTFSLLQKSNIGRSLSPLRRASASAERTMKCHLSAEHEFELSKQILLKHMKKAFFSVC